MVFSKRDTYTEDSACCKFCSLVDLPCKTENTTDRRRTSKRKATTGSSSSKDTTTKWVRCSTCDEWLHPSCNGLSEREYQKISSLLDSDKDFEFRCLECGVKFRLS